MSLKFFLGISYIYICLGNSVKGVSDVIWGWKKKVHEFKDCRCNDFRFYSSSYISCYNNIKLDLKTQTGSTFRNSLVETAHVWLFPCFLRCMRSLLSYCIRADEAIKFHMKSIFIFLLWKLIHWPEHGAWGRMASPVLNISGGFSAWTQTPHLSL